MEVRGPKESSLDIDVTESERKREGGNSLLFRRNCLFFPCEKVFDSISALKTWIP